MMMELSYEILWKACTWFLLCFLVTRLVSLVLVNPATSCDSVSGSVKDSRFKRTVDEYYGFNDGGDLQKKKKSVFDDSKRGFAVGDRLRVYDSKKCLTKRVKFDDKVMEFGNHDDLCKEFVMNDGINEGLEMDKVVFDDKVVEFGNYGISEEFVKDVELCCSDKVNVGNDHGDLCKELVENEGINEGFEMDNAVFDDYGEKGEFGKELVDQIVEEKGFSGVGDDKVGGKLESGVEAADFGNNKIVDCERNVENEDVVPFGDGEECVLNVEGLGGEQNRYASSNNVDRVAGREVRIFYCAKDVEVVGVGNEEEPGVDFGLGIGKVDGDRIEGGDKSGREFDVDEGVLSDDDEWQGIERSEIDKKFAIAVDFVKCQEVEGRLAKLGNDLVMQLYALEKIAMEGPCHEPQPMAIKLSARAKWNAWQKLGSMSPEEAMEQYIILLSDNIPEWKEGHSSGSV